MLRTGLAIAVCGALCACTTIDASKDHVSATYFGIVRVESPAVTRNVAASTPAPVVASEARGFGLRLQNGVGLGYFHDQNYEVPPDCRVVIFVQNQEQLESVARQFADFKEGVCSTVKSP